MFRVIILPRAEADIESAANWWAKHHSPRQAKKWFDTIHEQLKSLAQFPVGNGLSAENGDFPYEIRDKLLGLGSRPSYRTVFTVKGEVIYVLAVRHGAQDRIGIDDFDGPP